VLAANPKLRMLASQSITPDNIDVAAATARRIPVTVVPPIVAEATADINFGLMLMVARRMVEGDRLVRRGVFPGSQSNHLAGSFVYRKTIGLVGIGRIGQATGRRAKGFDMKILYTARHRRPEVEQELGAQYVTLDELLAQSDFVTLHQPLNAETRHMIGEKEFAKMKPTAYIINTARGPIIDEPALVRALAEKRIAGAGLDVFEDEPRVPEELKKMSHVVLTPHLGSAARELRATMANVVADNILAVLDGRQPPNCWNADIYKKT